MKTKNFILFLLLSCSLSLAAQEKEISFGGENKWEKVSLYNLKKHGSKKGLLDLVLEDKEYLYSDETDLLLHFNDESEKIPSSYQIKTLPKIDRRNFKFGSGSAAFSDVLKPMVLTPVGSSLLAPKNKIADFSIEFQMQPNDLSRRETVFYWKNVRMKNEALQHQYIICSIVDGFVEWSFINFFSDSQYNEYTISISSQHQLTTGDWSHHLVTFDSNYGKLCYYIDGKLENVRYATSTGKERGTVYLASVGENVDGHLFLGKVFYGQIDEFRILKSATKVPNLDLYSRKRGVLLSDPIDLNYSNSRLLNVIANEVVPANSNLFYYYRITNSRPQMLLWKNENASLYGEGAIKEEWKPFFANEYFSDFVQGRYLQLLVEIYPDGELKESPVLKNIKVVYSQDRPPVAPIGVVAIPYDSKVKVMWKAVAESDLAGYELYYGEASGNYFGDAKSVSSPIDVGNVTSYVVDNLENGKLYFFSVVSYDKTDLQIGKGDNSQLFNAISDRHKSEFSKEVSARPSRVYGDLEKE